LAPINFFGASAAFIQTSLHPFFKKNRWEAGSQPHSQKTKNALRYRYGSLIADLILLIPCSAKLHPLNN